MTSSRNSIKLFVGGLPPTLTCAELAEVFGPHSKKMTIDLKMDPSHQLNRGFAFLYLSDPLLVEEITKKNYNVKNRLIQVQVSRATSKNFRPEGCRVFCRGIPLGTSDLEITEFFQSFSNCRCAYAIRESSGDNKGFGFVELHSETDAQELLSKKSLLFKNSILTLEPFLKPKSKNSPREQVVAFKSVPNANNNSKKRAQCSDLPATGDWNFKHAEPETVSFYSRQAPGTNLLGRPEYALLQTRFPCSKALAENPSLALHNMQPVWESNSCQYNLVNQGEESLSLFHQEGSQEEPKSSMFGDLPSGAIEPSSRNMVYSEEGVSRIKTLNNMMGIHTKPKDDQALLFTRASTKIHHDLFAGCSHRLNHSEDNLSFRFGCLPPRSIRRYFIAN